MKNKKLIAKKKRYASNRDMGFVPLNEYFIGSTAHHINKIHVIFLRDTVHHSIPHNSNTGFGMDKINKIAFKEMFRHKENLKISHREAISIMRKVINNTSGLI